jgi:hypothetical protein
MKNFSQYKLESLLKSLFSESLLEQEIKFTNTPFDQIEEKLQIFIGKDLLQSIAIKKNKTNLQIKINKPLNCTLNTNFCRHRFQKSLYSIASPPQAVRIPV